MTVTIVIGREKLIDKGILSMTVVTMEVTVIIEGPEEPSLINPCKYQGYDDHDGDDDEIQTFSKGGAALFPQSRQ
jgi:hypothetical protein